MIRVLVVPAAGRGARLGSAVPKFLTPVAGVPMIDRVLARHAPHVARAVVVVAPADRARAQQHLRDAPVPVLVAEQPQPTGMLDALLAARAALDADAFDRAWISWCDQVAISRATADRLADLDRRFSQSLAVLPVIEHAAPYVHFDLDAAGRPVGVRHRREGDAMPAEGTADAGLFSLSRAAFRQLLPDYATIAPVGVLTGERNFLPFLPWAVSRGEVHTFGIAAGEATGINTPDDLDRAERWLAAHPE